MSDIFDGPPVHPLRDLFDAAVRHKSVKLTCTRCRHAKTFSAAALWWLFHRKGWQDDFEQVRRRFVCGLCLVRLHMRVRSPRLELVDDDPTDESFPLPSELDWKRELRRRR
ncbi:MAG TPA: hypothetical protein VGW40_10570 [Allosphingosinicella sp.]|nr:hypothetical protein [Allosphingosinicella sp.]